ncbi:hypothetical protein TP51_003338 [Salmonella enterica subsp. enterica]|nr:hypothetical protein [Salmonella enterica subsp. enterica serovar Rubislaw]EEA7823341.1 hypothetical protein [Salmonella enterica subsp. enterica serovar Miami]
MMRPHPEPTTGAKHVILHGDCWPVVSAVENAVKAVLPRCLCTTAPDVVSLTQLLASHPRAVMVFCLRPREHIFLFYRLRKALCRHPALVISDEFFFSDRILLRMLGQLPCMDHQSLLRMITSQQLCGLYADAVPYCPEDSLLTRFLLSPSLPPGVPERIPVFLLEAPLMEYLSLMMYREMTARGVSSLRLRLLQEMYAGHQHLDELARLLGVTKQKVWNEKHQLLLRLEMTDHLREIMYGTRFCLFLQRTPFRGPGEDVGLCETTDKVVLP